MAFTGFFLFSCCDVLAKKLTHMGQPAVQVSFFYAVIGIVFLLFFARRLGGLRATLQTKNRKLHLARALLQAPTQAMIFYGFSQLPLANAYAVLFLMPFLTAAFAVPMLKEHPKPIIWFIIGGGFVGVVIAMRPDIYGFSWAVIALLASAIMAGVRNNIIRMMPGETALSFSFFPSVAIALVTLPPTLMHFAGFTLTQAFMTLIGGLLFGAGIMLTSSAFRYAKSAIVAPTHYSQLIWGVAFGIAFFAHTPDPLTLLGLAIIGASGIALIRAKD